MEQTQEAIIRRIQSALKSAEGGLTDGEIDAAILGVSRMVEKNHKTVSNFELPRSIIVFQKADTTDLINEHYQQVVEFRLEIHELQVQLRNRDRQIEELNEKLKSLRKDNNNLKKLTQSQPTDLIKLTDPTEIIIEIITNKINTIPIEKVIPSSRMSNLMNEADQQAILPFLKDQQEFADLTLPKAVFAQMRDALPHGVYHGKKIKNNRILVALINNTPFDLQYGTLGGRYRSLYQNIGINWHIEGLNSEIASWCAFLVRAGMIQKNLHRLKELDNLSFELN